MPPPPAPTAYVPETFVFKYTVRAWSAQEEVIRSKPFGADGWNWQLKIFPRGDHNKTCEKWNTHLSVYLEPCGSDPDLSYHSWSRNVKFAISVGSGTRLETAVNFELAGKKDWGWKKFAKLPLRASHFDEGEDEVTFEVSVTYLDPPEARRPPAAEGSQRGYSAAPLGVALNDPTFADVVFVFPPNSGRRRRRRSSGGAAAASASASGSAGNRASASASASASGEAGGACGCGEAAEGPGGPEGPDPLALDLGLEGEDEGGEEEEEEGAEDPEEDILDGPEGGGDSASASARASGPGSLGLGLGQGLPAQQQQQQQQEAEPPSKRPRPGDEEGDAAPAGGDAAALAATPPPAAVAGRAGPRGEPSPLRAQGSPAHGPAGASGSPAGPGTPGASSSSPGRPPAPPRQCVYAHKVVLSARSPYFRALFGSGLRESGMREIPVAGCERDAFLDLLRFLYTGATPDLGRKKFAVFRVADRYAVEELRSKALSRIFGGVSAKSVIPVLRFATHFDRDDTRRLKQYALEYVSKHPEPVCRSPEFKRLLAEGGPLVGELFGALAARIRELQRDMSNRCDCDDAE